MTAPSLSASSATIEALVIEFIVTVIDEVAAVIPSEGTYVLESGIPLRVGDSTIIDPAGDLTSLEEVGIALVAGQTVEAVSDVLVRYTVYPFDVDIRVVTVLFHLVT